MDTLLNYISASVAFLFGVGIIYWFLDVTIGRIKAFNSKFEWNGLQIKDFVFLATSAIFILSNFSFYKPY